jgi:hypothetical protein
LFSVFFIKIITQYQKLKHKIDKNLSILIISFFIASFVNSNLSGHIGANIFLWFTLGIMYSLNKIDIIEKKQKSTIET